MKVDTDTQFPANRIPGIRNKFIAYLVRDLTVNSVPKDNILPVIKVEGLAEDFLLDECGLTYSIDVNFPEDPILAAWLQ